MPTTERTSALGRLRTRLRGPSLRAPSSDVRVRAPAFRFAESDIPRAWLYDNVHASHIANALQLLFPEGERMFIRSVKHYEAALPESLKARVRAFIGQEGRHGHEHERFFRVLEAQGLDVRGFVDWYAKLARTQIEERCSPALRLSMTCAHEHFTATLGRNLLTGDFLDRGAHPVVRDLFRWHAVEELEHKSVAFDVFEAVDGRYSMRIAGLVLATSTLFAFWALGARHLLAEEAKRGLDLAADLDAAKANAVLQAEGARRRRAFAVAFLEYLDPDFHPDRHDDRALLEATLASFELLQRSAGQPSSP